MTAERHIDQLEHALHTARQLFDAIFNHAAIGKVMVDRDGVCLLANAAFGQILDYPPEELVGIHFSEFTHPDDIETDLMLFRAVMAGTRSGYQLEKRYLRRDGQIVHILLSVTATHDEAGKPNRFIAEVLDMTERDRARAELQAANRKLQEQVVTDHLTGLANRRGFEEAVAAPIGDGGASLILLDLDHFKQINDRHGHEAGDLVLIEVSRRLRGLVRADDHIARLGGDEFAVILYRAGRERAETVSARLVASLELPHQVGGRPVSAGASIGVSFASAGGSLRDLLGPADQALYAAKRLGRGCWQVADQPLERMPS